jgi:hypothetical protein
VSIEGSSETFWAAVCVEIDLWGWDWGVVNEETCSIVLLDKMYPEL